MPIPLWLPRQTSSKNIQLQYRQGSLCQKRSFRNSTFLGPHLVISNGQNRIRSPCAMASRMAQGKNHFRKINQSNKIHQLWVESLRVALVYECLHLPKKKNYSRPLWKLNPLKEVLHPFNFRLKNRILGLQGLQQLKDSLQTVNRY